MPKRDSNGRFVREEEENEGFLHEFRGFLAFSYRFWRILPILLVVVLIWKYFHISDKIIEILVELLCGSGCRCPASCGSPPTTETQKKSSF
jgi:hypothetical protein